LVHGGQCAITLKLCFPDPLTIMLCCAMLQDHELIGAEVSTWATQGGGCLAWRPRFAFVEPSKALKAEACCIFIMLSFIRLIFDTLTPPLTHSAAHTDAALPPTFDSFIMQLSGLCAFLSLQLQAVYKCSCTPM
jgi:hypothetical protein